MKLFAFLANPARFRKLFTALVPAFAVNALVFLCAGLYTGLVTSPPDYQQGESVRIMYVHVPSAWAALGLYTAMAVAALIAFVWKHELADIFIRAAAPVGAAFAALCLVTGSIWGKPTWGAWWVWDARLTSMLLLFFLYLGAMALRGAFDHAGRAARAVHILLILGVINVPIVKFSVDWWHTLHQGASLLRKGGSAIDKGMALPLSLMAIGVFCLIVTTVTTSMLAYLDKNAQKRS